MKKIFTAILIMAICLLPAFSQNGGNGGQGMQEVVSDFDINAYLRDPITAADTFYINVYDSISMRAGALNRITASKISEITDDSYMKIDPYLLEVLAEPGIPIISMECSGRVAKGGGSNFVGISAEILDIRSKTEDIKTSTGFQKVGSTGTVIPYTLSFISEKTSDSKVVKAPKTTDMAGGAIHKVVATSAGTSTQPVNWDYNGSLYLHINASDYESVPMGTYRTIIKINITTGK